MSACLEDRCIVRVPPPIDDGLDSGAPASQAKSLLSRGPGGGETQDGDAGEGDQSFPRTLRLTRFHGDQPDGAGDVPLLKGGEECH